MTVFVSPPFTRDGLGTRRFEGVVEPSERSAVLVQDVVLFQAYFICYERVVHLAIEEPARDEACDRRGHAKEDDPFDQPTGQLNERQLPHLSDRACILHWTCDVNRRCL
jgi:hypothetical protein